MSVSSPTTPATPPVNQAPEGFDPAREFGPEFLEFLAPLHGRFSPWRSELIAARRARLARSLDGDRPGHRSTSPATEGSWRVELPEWCTDQRNQMTGPADDAALVVKMLNSGAPGVMLDLEDSMANTWRCQQEGVKNVIAAVHGELSYEDKKRGQTVSISESDTVVLTRARGLHLGQRGIFSAEMSASLFDVASVAFRVDPTRLRHPLCFYIPKTESAEEALWWDALFKAVIAALGWSADSIRCMALVESHPMAYEIEEFAFNLKDHLIGLNLGRWDYMASLIHFNLDDPEWVLPDRNTIPHDVAFFQNLRGLIPEVCHSRGLLAIGGMTALYPSRIDADLNERALAALAKDKGNEAECLFDGAWTGHPDQNEIAVSQFPYPNQLSKRDPNADRHPDLRPAPTGIGRRTVDGTRAAIRTVIRYRSGVLSGKGASLLDGYMEDLATDRIYRLMVAQRMLHAASVEVMGDDGKPAMHTPELVSRLFDEELDKIVSELPADTGSAIIHRYTEARRISEAMITTGAHDPV